ncbi:MAG TPA: aldo/keto reductase [Steroidobacteraceae bacterium]|nr:aldo/keto reductase [Steroidobacteraceae bacterium]
MQYVRLGTSGLKVSRICLGCMSFGSGADWMLPEQPSFAIVRKALDFGINFFDTANVYSAGESEEILGRALKAFDVPREQVVIATKLFHPMGAAANERGLSRKHVLHAIDASLRRLDLDYVDLYQIHRFDLETPIEETLEALAQIVRAGKVRYLGASTMAAYQFAKLLYRADQLHVPRFISMQNNYSLLYREEEREMIPLCREEGIGLIPYSPIGGGLLAGSRRTNTARSHSPMARDRFRRAADEAVIDAVGAVAKERGVGPAQIAIAWLLQQPGLSAPIVGATRVQHLEDPVRALELTLSKEELARLEGAYQTQPPLPVYFRPPPSPPPGSRPT